MGFSLGQPGSVDLIAYSIVCDLQSRRAGPGSRGGEPGGNNLFARINQLLDEATEGTGGDATNPYYVVSDAAFALLGSQNLHRVEHRSFFAQNGWLAIGYSVGAVTGVKLARPETPTGPDP